MFLSIFFSFVYYETIKIIFPFSFWSSTCSSFKYDLQVYNQHSESMSRPVSHTTFIFILRCHGGGRCAHARVHSWTHFPLERFFCSQNNWHRRFKYSTFLCSLFVSPGFMHFLYGIYIKCFSRFHLTFPTRLYFSVLSLKSKNLSLVLERDGLMVKITYALVEDLSLILSTYTRWLMAPCNSNSWEIWYPLWLLSGIRTHMHIPTQRHITYLKINL